jgi:hypothetical protein
MNRSSISPAESVRLFARYWRRSLLVAAALAAAAFITLLVVNPWQSAGEAEAVDDFFIMHSAKFVCGTAGPSDPVAPGDYETAINVHNFTADYVSFYKKAVLALPETEPQQLPSEWVSAYLDPDYAFEIDCDEIGQWLFPAGPPAFYKGFVVISYAGSEPLLDVVGVYTGTDTDTPGVGESMDVERIEGERHDWVKPDPVPEAYYTYSAKFVCGSVAAGEIAPVVPGDYETAINVHNPWEETGDEIGLYKKAVWAQTEEVTPAPPSSWEYYTIYPNRAFEIDCSEIAEWLWPLEEPPAFYKGFVVIESPNELDVVGVYTAERIETEGKGFALDIEAVPYTRQPAPVIR